MNFFGGTFFSGGFFGDVTTKTGTGGIDPGDGLKRRRTIVKPTGLSGKKKLTPAQRQIEEIVQSGSEIHSEIAGRLAREFTEDVFDESLREFELEQVGKKRIAEMTSREIDREIGILMREKLRIEREEEELAMMLMIAADV